ncbi:MAG: hypothetical protein PHU46_03420 [Rhodocyclaceae bacterium]|nr:hypothetical protein [Rhodocyclaceae bacterium]
MTIRPVDTQGGEGLVRLDAVADLEAYLSACPDTEFYVAQYVDYRGMDGLFRKLRVALVDGRPYVCHLAISDAWMVHYVSAAMQQYPARRDEEAVMMANFDLDFGSRHGAAFDAIADRLGLDYVVLDCGEMPDGRLLLFEVDTCGWIHATDSVALFPYKRSVMEKAFQAFRAMLLNRVSDI